jgi:hypothetical protein
MLHCVAALLFGKRTILFREQITLGHERGRLGKFQKIVRNFASQFF